MINSNVQVFQQLPHAYVGSNVPDVSSIFFNPHKSESPALSASHARTHASATLEGNALIRESIHLYVGINITIYLHTYI